MWLLSLENKICIRKEVSNSGKNQTQGNQENAFEPVHTENGPQFRKN